jgi:holo-[acyl-carrier protein] synthase
MSRAARLGVGIDLVCVSRVAESLERFGERYLRRVYTDAEIAYATSSPGEAAARLAARFAAKEAAFKALRLEDPVDWRNIEVRRSAEGRCDLAFHGAVGRAVDRSGITDVAVSLGHEGDYATAVVVTRASEQGPA